MHFRNLGDLSLEFDPRCNVLYGQNGQGKTNILEALYLLSTLRSFHTHRLDELIAFDSNGFSLWGQIEKENISHTLSVKVLRGKPIQKTIEVDSKSSRSIEYMGNVHAIVFVPEDVSLPSASPSLRRKFIDRAIWNIHPSYLKEAQLYERLLKQRNAALRNEDSEVFSLFDEPLAAAGAVIYRRRVLYLAQLQEYFSTTFSFIGHVHGTGRVSYRSVYGREGDLDTKGALLEALMVSRKRDLDRGYTHVGPHGDDIEFFFGDCPVAGYASQGQTRAFILALKMAEILHFYRTKAVAPVLLLDDVCSELDEIRSAHLFSFLEEIPSQLFITATETKWIPQSFLQRTIRVLAGDALVVQK